MAFITLERTHTEIAIVRLDRPKANALSPEMLLELLETATLLCENPPRAAIIWGGPRIFAAGADISRFDGPNEARTIGALFHRALNKISQIPRPTIAAISGVALGGGCELALACDFRIATQEAKVGQPEITLGIIPGGGATQRLPRLIGVSRAKELIFSGRQIDANEALSIGLIDKIAISPDELLPMALAWAEQFAIGATLSIALAKKAIDLGVENNLENGLQIELELFAESFATQDSKIGINSFLTNGPGKAKFLGK